MTVAELLEKFHQTDAVSAGVFFLLLNFGVFVGSITLCWALGRIFHGRRLFDRWEPLNRIELARISHTFRARRQQNSADTRRAPNPAVGGIDIPCDAGIKRNAVAVDVSQGSPKGYEKSGLAAALGAVVLNAAVSLGGWFLWTAGWITLRPMGLVGGMIDCVVMILFMDLGMYVFHRAAHWPIVFKLVHRFHHRHEATNPISLFVLHPAEVIGFAALMIAFLCVYSMTLGGLMAFLTLNVLFGTLGHSGVEPFPAKLRKLPVLGLIGTSTFHAEHHEHPSYNFGFYTLLWDKWFGTLDPDYDERFGGSRRRSNAVKD